MGHSSSESLDKCNAKQAPNKSIVSAVLFLTAIFDLVLVIVF